MAFGGSFGGIPGMGAGAAGMVPGGAGAMGMLGGLAGLGGGGSIMSGMTAPGVTTPVAGGDPTTPGEGGFDIESFITENPQYKFLQTEGLRGLQRTAAAKGMFGSGNLLRDLTSFSSGLASQSYGSEMDRIMKMAGVGAGSPAAAGQSFGQAASRGTGYGQQALGSLGGLFDLFQ